MSELSAELIAGILTTRRLGQRVEYYPCVSSTNDVAHARARAGAPDGTLIVTDEQTAGRGRLDRSWWAPSGTCLLMSLLLRPVLPLGRAGQLAMCLGLGSVEGVADVTGLRIALKWPNDLVLGGRKVGGMLSELAAEGDQVGYAVIGLGLNVNLDIGAESDYATLPAELAGSATSLREALGKSVDRAQLLGAILARCEVWLDGVLAGESPATAWAGHLETLEQRVTVALGTSLLHGVATGVTAEGALILKDDSGEDHVIWSGDVVHLRSA